MPRYAAFFDTLDALQTHVRRSRWPLLAIVLMSVVLLVFHVIKKGHVRTIMERREATARAARVDLARVEWGPVPFRRSYTRLVMSAPDRAGYSMSIDTLGDQYDVREVERDADDLISCPRFARSPFYELREANGDMIATARRNVEIPSVLDANRARGSCDTNTALYNIYAAGRRRMHRAERESVSALHSLPAVGIEVWAPATMLFGDFMKNLWLFSRHFFWPPRLVVHNPSGTNGTLELNTPSPMAHCPHQSLWIDEHGVAIRDLRGYVGPDCTQHRSEFARAITVARGELDLRALARCLERTHFTTWHPPGFGPATSPTWVTVLVKPVVSLGVVARTLVMVQSLFHNFEYSPKIDVWTAESEHMNVPIEACE
jgi:hypothetical protein